MTGTRLRVRCDPSLETQLMQQRPVQTTAFPVLCRVAVLLLLLLLPLPLQRVHRAVVAWHWRHHYSDLP